MIRTVLESIEEMESINLSNLRNPIHREFMNDTLLEARKCEGVTQYLGNWLQALEEAYAEEMQASLIDERVQTLTQEVNDLAVQRGYAQTALKSAMRAVMGMPDADKVAAATVMFNMMHKYDLHAGMNVDEQTAVIDSFILDVQQNYLQTLEVTGMSVLFDQLKDWNERVCQKVIERDEAKVGLGVGRMVNARQATDEAWRNLRRAVNGYSFLNGYEPFADFIGYMNVLIIRYKRVHIKQETSSPEAVPGEETTGTFPGEQQPGAGGGSGENTSPGGSTGGEQQPGTGGETGGTTKYTVTYMHNGAVYTTQQVEPGQRIQLPAAPQGYKWTNIPPSMPEHDVTITSQEMGEDDF